MNPDDLKQAWQTQTSQSKLSIDAEVVLKDVQRNQHQFTTALFWRDVREVGTSLLLIPVWLFLGAKLALPWTWYLTLPALVWVAGYMLVDRMRFRSQPPTPDEALRQRVENSLAQTEHQIWLLRNIFWWYLLPIALPMLAFFGHVGLQVPREIGGRACRLRMVCSRMSVLGFVYWLNLHAVRNELGPRRQELETLLSSLNDETPA